MSLINSAEYDLLPFNGGGAGAISALNALSSMAIPNEMVVNGIEVDGGNVPWHAVQEAFAIYLEGLVATKFAKILLWASETGATNECFCVAAMPDQMCVPCQPDTFCVPAKGGQC